MSRIFLIASIVVSSLCLAIGYWLGGLLAIALSVLLWGAFWLIAVRRGWSWFANIGLLETFSLAAAALWLKLPAVWMLAGALGSLLAWDLTAFTHRLQLGAPQDDLRILERNHLIWLGLLAGLGLLLSIAAAWIPLRLTLGWGLLLAALAGLGLLSLITWLLRE